MNFRPEGGDLRVISAFLIGLVVGMAVLMVWRDANSRRPVYAVHESPPIREQHIHE